jgi:dTDP-4-dehydrorhamnose reductase
MADKTKILFIGGSGLLGGEFRKICPSALYPSRDELDVRSFEQVNRYFERRNIENVVHAAAFTSPPKVDKDPELALDSNIVGTCNVVKVCMRYNVRMVYISTDYVFDGDKGNYKEDDPLRPVNKYAWSKLGGECAVKMYDNSVIIRTSFGPNEFPYDKAFVDQWTSRESVSVIAGMILRIVESDYRGTIHVGGARKTVYDYALNLSPNKSIGKLLRDDVSFIVPKDTSLNTELYKSIFGD